MTFQLRHFQPRLLLLSAQKYFLKVIISQIPYFSQTSLPDIWLSRQHCFYIDWAIFMKLSMKNMSIRETSFSLLTNNANTTAIECKYTRIYPVEFLLSTVDQIENIQTVCSIYSTYSYQYIRQPGMSKRHSCTGIDFLMHLEPLISKLVCVS